MKAAIAKADAIVFPTETPVTISGSGAELRKGIWPRSAAFWMAAFYVALFIIRPWEQLFPVLASFHFERVYALLMIAVVLLDPNKRFRMDFQTFGVLLFAFSIAVSLVFARNTGLAWDPFYEYLTMLVFYFILIVVIRTPYQLAFMVTCYIVTTAAYLGKSQWEYFVHDAGTWDMGVNRMVGIESTFGGPNSLAMSIVVSLPMVLFLYSARKKFPLGWPEFWRKWFPRSLVGYFVLAATSLALTNSRSGMLGFVLFVVLVGVRGKRRWRKLVGLGVAILVLLFIWLILPAEQKGRYRTIWNPEAGPANAQVSAEGRKEGFKAGITMFKRFPLTGVGIGNFNEYRFAHVDGSNLSPHNMVGQLLGETGLVGGVAFALMVGITLANARKVRALARRRSDTTAEVLSGLALACRDSIILLAFEGLFGHNVRRFNWLWLAAFCVLAVEYSRQHISTRPPDVGLKRDERSVRQQP